MPTTEIGVTKVHKGQGERLFTPTVDATPDEDYPLRILRGHLQEAEGSRWTDNTVAREPTDPLVIRLNHDCQLRAAVLRRAIATLEAARAKLEREGKHEPE